MPGPPSIEQLVRHVEAHTRDEPPEARLRTAIDVARQLGDAADLLVERFVAEARAAGMSWAQVGELFGTSKQAAQQRYGAAGPEPGRWAPTARDVLDRAGQEARALGHNYVGTEHALLVLLSAGDDLAGQVLAGLGVTREAVLAQFGTAFDPRPYDRLCVMPRLKRSLENARWIADGLGRRGAGTEHVLAGMLAVHDAVAVELLARLGVSPDDVRAALAARLGVGADRLVVSRPRRRRLLVRTS